LVVDVSASPVLIVFVEGIAGLGQEIQMALERHSQPIGAIRRFFGQQRLDVHVT
jgi:hypothetical protein